MEYKRFLSTQCLKALQRFNLPSESLYLLKQVKNDELFKSAKIMVLVLSPELLYGISKEIIKIKLLVMSVHVTKK